jgi:hypothetical protein
MTAGWWLAPKYVQKMGQKQGKNRQQFLSK